MGTGVTVRQLNSTATRGRKYIKGIYQECTSFLAILKSRLALYSWVVVEDDSSFEFAISRIIRPVITMMNAWHNA
jgi:hypothetical protein